MIASPEVELEKDHVKKMSEILYKYPAMLVVGYALKAFTDDNYEFNRYGKGHILGSKYEVYKAPWNTCAMWNAKLFREYVGAFNVICDCPGYLGKKNGKKLQGMEDVLAMALAKRTNSRLKIKLIRKPFLPWQIKKERIKDHEEKMKRKRLVHERYNEIFNDLPPLEVEQLDVKS